MLLNAKKEAFGQIDFERWQLFMKLFSKEELMEIADNNKLITKYIILGET